MEATEMLAVMVQKPGRKSKHIDDDICLLVQINHVLFTTLVGPTAGMQTIAGRPATVRIS
jgi:hypothetical protein